MFVMYVHSFYKTSIFRHLQATLNIKHSHISPLPGHNYILFNRPSQFEPSTNNPPSAPSHTCPLHPLPLALCTFSHLPFTPSHTCPPHPLPLALCTLSHLPSAPSPTCPLHLLTLALCTVSHLPSAPSHTCPLHPLTLALCTL